MHNNGELSARNRAGRNSVYETTALIRGTIMHFGRRNIFALLSAMFAGAALAGPLDPAKIIDREKMKPRGEWEEVTVPDTLDLAERAQLSLNYLTGNTVPEKGHALYHILYFD